MIIILLDLLPFALNAQTAFSELAKTYALSGNFEEAIRLETQSIELLKHDPENTESYVISLANLAFYNEQIGDINEAIRLEQNAISVLKQWTDHDHELMALLMIDLASYYSNIGNYKQSIVVGNECREFIISTSGRASREYLTCLNNLAISYSEFGDHENAFKISTEVLDLLKTIESNDKTYEISPLLIISIHYLEIGNYAESLKNALSALNISKSLGDNNHMTSRCLNVIASIYDAIGDYQECIKYAEESTQIRKLLDGEHSVTFARSLNNLSQFYAHAGIFKEALNYGEEAKTIRLEALGENHPEYLNSLHSIACIYEDLGNYQDAKLTEEFVAAKRKELLGEAHPSYLTAMMGVSTSCAYLGQYNEAINIGSLIDSIIVANSLYDATLYDSNIHNLIWYYSCDNQFEEASVYANKLIEICENKFGDKSLEYIKALDALAYLYYKRQNYKEAIKTKEEILRTIEQFYGQKHPLYIHCIADLTVLYCYDDNAEMLKVYAHRAFDKIKSQYTSYFSFMTSSERRTVWGKRRNLFCKTFPQIAYKNFKKSKEYVSLAYDAILFAKGILLNSEIEFDRFLTNLESKELTEKYIHLRFLRRQLNKFYEKPIPENSSYSNSLEKEVNTLERQLMQESSEYGEYTKAFAINWKDVRDNLKDNEAAIEFVSFPLTNDSTIYMSYVLRQDMDAPVLVKLFEESEISSLSDEELYKKINGSQLIWAKLQSELNGVDNIYFAPDGVLHQIGIESFPDFDNPEKLISDKYNLYRLSSTRQLAIKNQTHTTNNAVIYGGIQYDISPEVMAAENRKYDISSSRRIQLEYNVADSLSIRSGLDFLKFTLKEATLVSDVLQNADMQYQLITGNEATEESLKNLSGSNNNILHIATHGFYWDKSEAEYRADVNERLLFMSQLGDNARRNIEGKALTRTGLFMAGANNALAGKDIPDGVDDGILTAQEIANLDFHGLDLVVLSACQTGMGDISGDGVFGLQRGFKKAGANSILMSLWDVNDEATQILMTEFYKNYLNGMSKRESLLAAQKAVRETTRFEDPEYWAAFILLDGLN